MIATQRRRHPRYFAPLICSSRVIPTRGQGYFGEANPSIMDVPYVTTPVNLLIGLISTLDQDNPKAKGAEVPAAE